MSVDESSAMSQATARLLIRAFAYTYKVDTSGEFVNKIGERAEDRSIDLVLEAQADHAHAR